MAQPNIRPDRVALLRDRITAIHDQVENLKAHAVFFGSVALAAVMIETSAVAELATKKSPVTPLEYLELGASAVALLASVPFAIHSSLTAIHEGQREAALEGALAQYELDNPA